MSQECCRVSSRPSAPWCVCVCVCVCSSEVEVLQVDVAQRAREQVKVLLGEIHRAVQGALQAGRQARVPGEEREVRQRQGGRGGGGGGRGGSAGLRRGDRRVPVLGERASLGLHELHETREVRRVGGARYRRLRGACGSARPASFLRRGLCIVPAVMRVGGRRWIAAPGLAVRRRRRLLLLLPGAGRFQRLTGVRGRGVGALERLELAGFVASAVPVVRRLALVLHPPVLEPDFDLPLGEVQEGGYLHPPGPAQVLVEVELLLQLQQLRVGVGGAQPAGPGASAVHTRLARVCRAQRTDKIQIMKNGEMDYTWRILWSVIL